MKFEQFKDEVIAAYGKYFNGSRCNVRFAKCLGRTIWIDCFLAADRNEVSNGIEQNDMMKVTFNISLPDRHEITDELPDLLTLEITQKWYAVAPENRYLYCDVHSMPYRKSKGTAEKLEKQLNKYFGMLRDAIAEDRAAGRIHKDFSALVDKRLIVA